VVNAAFQLPADPVDYTIQICLGHHWWWQTGTVVQPSSGDSLTFQFNEYGGINATTTTPPALLPKTTSSSRVKASWTSLANRGSIPRAPSAFGLPREIPRPITWFEYKARQYAFDLSGTQNVTIRGIHILGAASARTRAPLIFY
jgi:hypothetical protein